MNFKGKKKLIKIIEKIHLYIFGHDISDKMREFLDNLSWSFFGGVISGLLLFIATIIAGRFLGPEEFGRYNVIIIISQLFLIPMLLGMDMSSVRFISQTKNKKKQSKYISTAMAIVGMSIIVTSSTLFLFSDELVKYMHVDGFMVLIAILFSAALSCKMLFDGYMRGLKLFEYQSIVRIIEAIIVVSALIIALFLLHNYEYVSYMVPILIGMCIAIVLCFMRIHKQITLKINIKTLKQLFGYGKFVILGSILGVVLAMGDRFLINTYLGSEELGIYMAYYTISISLVTQLTTIMINVFFPNIADIDNKIFIMNKIEKLMLIGFVPIILTLTLFIFVAIHLFGQEYPILIGIIILFALLGTLQFFVSFFASIVNIHSRQTYFWGLSLLAVRAIIFVVYAIVLIYLNYLNLYTLLVGLILNYVVDIFNLRFIIKKYA